MVEVTRRGFLRAFVAGAAGVAAGGVSTAGLIELARREVPAQMIDNELKEAALRATSVVGAPTARAMLPDELRLYDPADYVITSFDVPAERWHVRASDGALYPGELVFECAEADVQISRYEWLRGGRVVGGGGFAGYRYLLVGDTFTLKAGLRLV